MNYNFDKVIDRTLTNAEKYSLRRQIFGTDDLLPMWVADMDIATPPFIVKAIRERAAHPIYGYESLPESAYQAQIDWMKRRHGLELQRHNMLFSPSVVTSINVAIQAFSEPGDGIIVQQPVYFPFFTSVEHNDRRVLSNPLRKTAATDWTFDLEQLQAIIDDRTKMLILCSPHNPVGRVWRREELQALAEICLEHNIIVFADELHSDLVYPAYRHIPFASLSEEVPNITITALGPGKSFNLAGLSAATVAISSARLRRKFRRRAEANHIGHGSIFGHVAFETAYRDGEEWLEQLLNYLVGNLTMLQQLCHKYSDKIICNAPQGTYLAWLDCSGLGMSDAELLHFFSYQVKLGLGAGPLYGSGGEQYMRLNFAVPRPTMRRAIELLEAQLKRIC